MSTFGGSGHDGPSRTFTYTNNLLTKCTDFNGIAASQTYDSNNYVNSVTDRNGHTTNYTCNAVTGRLRQVQFPAASDAPAGRGTVLYTYTDSNNAYYVYSIADEGNNTTTFLRDGNHRVYQINYPDGGYETFVYNGFGQVTSHRMTTGGTETFTYDARGMKTQYRDPYHASGNPSAWYQYSATTPLDRLIGVTDALATTGPGDINHTTSYAYNNRGQVTVTTLPKDPNDGTRHTVSNGYNNADGTLASVTDELGHVTSYIWDAYRRLTSITTPVRGNGDNSVNTTTYSYTRWGTNSPFWHTANFPFVITSPAGTVINNDCDNNFRKTILRQAPGTSDDAWTYYTYDNVGNLTQVQDPLTRKTITTLDERNRPSKITDALTNPTSFTYDAAGRKASVMRANGQVITYDSYDQMNRLLQQTATQSPESNAVTKYAWYNFGGQLHTMTDPNNNTYTYAYDLLNRKTSLGYPGGTSETWTYNTTGNGTLYQFKNRAGNIETFTCDNSIASRFPIGMTR